jgi:hypothetical protein
MTSKATSAFTQLNNFPVHELFDLHFHTSHCLDEEIFSSNCSNVAYVFTIHIPTIEPILTGIMSYFFFKLNFCYFYLEILCSINTRINYLENTFFFLTYRRLSWMNCLDKLNYNFRFFCLIEKNSVMRYE